MSKIICFEKWDCDCGTLNQMSFEFDNSFTLYPYQSGIPFYFVKQ